MSDPSPTPPLGSCFAPVGAVLAATATSFVLHGYGFGVENHHIQIPLLHALADPSLYPDDPLMTAMQHYVSFFWPGIAFLARFLALPTLFLIGHVLVTAAGFGGVWALARRFFPASRAPAWLALWMVLFARSDLGAEPLHWNYFTHTSVAHAAGVWILVLAVSGRFRTALLLAGLVMNVHAMQSVYLLGMIGLAVVAGRRGVARTLVTGCALFLLAAAPWLIWMLSSPALQAPSDLPDLIREFFPYHFYPSSFWDDQWLHAGLLLFMLLLCARFGTPGTAEKRALWMGASLVFFGVVGGVLAEVWPTGFLLKLHVFRASSYLCTLALVLFSVWLWRGYRELAKREIPQTAAWASLPLLALYGSASLLLAEPRPRLVLLGLSVAGLLVAVGPAFHAGLVKRRRPIPQLRRLQVTAASFSLLLSVWLLQQVLTERIADAHSADNYLVEWTDVQRWAREHSEPEDRFLTPPYLCGFRMESRRSVVGEWKDGAALLFDPEYAAHWRAWYGTLVPPNNQDVRPCWQRLAQAWFAQDESTLLARARQFGARFVVVRRARPAEREQGWSISFSQEPLYDNGTYQVFAVPD